MIRYLKRNQINTEKYDTCIENAIQSRIYAFSWYLDIVAENWDVLVLNDYEAVMPLPWKRKYFIKYITQPFFCQQLGVFSVNQISNELQKIFVDNIPHSFLNIKYQFNSQNIIFNLTTIKKINYILSLDKSYSDLKRAYRKDRKYRTNQVQKEGYTIVAPTSDQLLSIAKKHYSYIKIPHQAYHNLRLLIEVATKKNAGFTRGVFNADKKLLGGCFFLKSKNRLVYLFSVMTPEGKKHQIATLLIDGIINEYADSRYLLDFEGSIIPNIASFYKSFGAVKERYSFLKKINL